jgi:hypothetical protein
MNKANYYYKQFITKKRHSGENFITLKDEADENLKKVIHDIHDIFDVLPNDWIYEKIENAFFSIVNDGFEDIDDFTGQCEADIYTNELLEWAKDGYAQYLIEETHEEFGYNSGHWTDIIRFSQEQGIKRIYEAVWNFVEEQAEEDEEETINE